MKGRTKFEVWSKHLNRWRTVYVKNHLVDTNAELLTRAGLYIVVSLPNIGGAR